MPDKGKIMSQTYYERQSKLLNLYRESFARKEMNLIETVTALRMMGFSEAIAINRVNEWETQFDTHVFEIGKAKKASLKQQISLEKYVLRMRLGKKYYDEYMLLRSKYMQKELSKEDVLKKLIQSGYSLELSKCILNKWEIEG